jgi:hypothetical protein
MSELITDKLSSVRSRHTSVSIFTGLALAIALILVWTTLAMWIDWNVANGLPRWARTLSLVLELVAVAAIVYTFIIRPITRAPDDEEVALMIERQWPDFNTRLIASVQLTQPHAAAALTATHSSTILVKAMVRQAEKLAEETQVTDVVKTRTLNRALLAAAIICVLVIFLFLWAQPTSGALLQRAFLSQVALPTKTHLENVTGDLNIALGDALKITATVSGYQPYAGRIDITYASGRSQTLPLDKDPNTPGAYAITLDAIHESFTYAVHVYDAHSQTFKVTALERPAVAKVEIYQVYPAYTGLGTVKRDPADLVLLAGSRLKLKVTSTRPLRVAPAGPGKANYVLRAIDEKVGHSDIVPLVRSHTNVNEASIETPDGAGMTLPNGLQFLSIHLIDTDDLESKDTAAYQVQIIPDRAPTVRIFEPERKEELVTAQAKLEIGYIAEDDILLGKVTLKYKQIATDSGEESAVESIPLPLPAKSRSQKTKYLWDITKIPIPAGKPTLEGSVVEYWLEVEDTNNLSGPGKSATEHYAIRVVTRAEKQAEMMARSGETISGIKSASEDQDNLAQTVRQKINPNATRPSLPPAENP